MLQANRGKTLELLIAFLLKCPHMGAKVQRICGISTNDNIQQSSISYV